MITLATTVTTAREIQTSDVILLIVYLVLLLVGAYYLTKFVSKRAMQRGRKRRFPGDKAKWKQGQVVSVVDRIPIERGKTLMVVEFNNKHYLMATTEQDVKLLDTVEMQAEADVQAEETPQQAYQSAGQETDIPEESFWKRFWNSFRQVSRNYYKNKNTTPFGIHLSKELDSKEGDGIHPDHGGTGSE